MKGISILQNLTNMLGENINIVGAHRELTIIPKTDVSADDVISFLRNNGFTLKSGDMTPYYGGVFNEIIEYGVVEEYEKKIDGDTVITVRIGYKKWRTGREWKTKITYLMVTW